MGLMPGSARTSSDGCSCTSPNGRNGERPATASQLRAIRAIAERLGLDAETVTRDGTGISLAELSLRQASGLIDQLKARDGQSSRR